MLTLLLDGTTKVYVEMKAKNSQPSKKEQVKDAYGEEDPLSPPRPAKPSTAPRADPTSSTGSVVADLPMRTASFAGQHGPMIDYMGTTQHHPFGESTMSAHSQPAVNPSGPMVMGHHHTGSNGRRGSLFADFTSPGNNSVFSNQWQPVSSAPNHPSGYAYASPQTHPDPQGYVNTSLPMAPTERQGYMPSNFNELSRTGGYDPNAMFRQPMPPSPEDQAQPYGYASSAGADMRGPHPPMDPGSHHHGPAEGGA
jgi:hypothetical protein